MTPYQGILAFFTAVGEVANVFTLLLQHQYTQDADLKAAKDELLQQWKDAYASQDISVVTAVLDRMRLSQ